jgi:hypothetical protein
MPDSSPFPDLLFEIEGRSVQLRASRLIVGVWEVFDSAVLLGTLAESHSFRQMSNSQYLARRAGSRAAELVDGLSDGVRFLVGL